MPWRQKVFLLMDTGACGVIPDLIAATALGDTHVKVILADKGNNVHHSRHGVSQDLVSAGVGDSSQ